MNNDASYSFWKPSIISGLGISLREWELEFLWSQRISVVTPAAQDSVSTGVEGKANEGRTRGAGRYLMLSSASCLRSSWRRCKLREKIQKRNIWVPGNKKGFLGHRTRGLSVLSLVPLSALGLFRVGQLHWRFSSSLPYPLQVRGIVTKVPQATVRGVISCGDLDSQLSLGSCCPS